ncbi:MAG: TlyA family RNA methyltransferase [Desulfofustis sp.]|nr:TlyA family RNA methyltransferase [Desulfofustis sp.]
MSRTRKQRLDELLVERELVGRLDQAEQLIRAGKVLVSEVVADKPGRTYPENAVIRIRQQPVYVSRGGIKLAGALDRFAINPCGWVCADIGASTGGFTDCLLQRGARIVYAVDVGYGILHWKLRSDERVVVRERCNARDLTARQIERPLDLAVLDTSFISLTKLIPPLLPRFGEKIRIVALVKPQFELRPERVGRGGIVSDAQAQQEAVAAIRDFSVSLGLSCEGIVASPITGTKGNQEYLLYLTGCSRSG